MRQRISFFHGWAIMPLFIFSCPLNNLCLVGPGKCNYT
jgi:hypothetical protein